MTHSQLRNTAFNGEPREQMKPKRIQRRRTKGWSKGHSDSATCLSCNRVITAKPVECAEPRHQSYYDQRLRRNNEYRRERRAKARSVGKVYRGGRGNPTNKADYQRRQVAVMRDVLFYRLGTACARCGFTDKRALQFDHRKGGGSAHRRLIPGGLGYLRHLFAFSTDELQKHFQVLCANCNVIKRVENGENRAR